MSLTEQQKAYHLRKMRTCGARLDVNKDGVVSREDFELMSERLSKYSNLTDERSKSVTEGFMKIADLIHLKKGVKFSVEEFVSKLSETLLSKSLEDRRAMIRYDHAPLFEVLDTNSDGHISVEEFKVYLKVMAPDVSEEEAEHAFKTIDTDKNGEISSEEFFASAEEFFYGVEETEVSRVFWGKLVD